VLGLEALLIGKRRKTGDLQLLQLRGVLRPRLLDN